MNKEMLAVTKEDFKRYLTECPKIAWIFHSFENFQKTVQLKKQKKIEIHYKTPTDNEDDYNSSAGFEVFELYFDLLNKNENELDENQIIQREILKKQLNDTNGFEIIGIPAETIVDGNEVGLAAREYFIEKLYKENLKNKTNYKYFDLSNLNYEESIEKTKELLKDLNYKYLFEPTFEFMNSKLKIRCDVLINHGNNRIEIIEFKASTSSKVVHFFDVFYQKKVLEKNNYIIDDIKIGLIEKNYLRGVGIISERDHFEVIEEDISFENDIKLFIEKLVLPNLGESDLNYNQLIKITNQLENTVTKPNLLDLINKFEESGFDFDEIIIEISNSFKDDEFLFKRYCKKFHLKYKASQIIEETPFCKTTVPYYDKKEFNLYELTRFKKEATIINNLFEKQQEIYIKNLQDLDDSKYIYMNKNIFGADQKRIIKVVKKYLETGINVPANLIKEEGYDRLLNLLKDYYKFPVYMYDFETVKWAIPKYDNSWSYEQIPFQYSIHVIEDEKFDFNNSDLTMKHMNFIANKQEDPRPEFLVNFVRDCFKYGPGIYVAYNKSFEKMVLKNLIFLYPEFEKPLKYIYQNTIDLMNFFKKSKDNWLIYHPDFRGSYSIKKTQPALDNRLNYKDLKINKGDKASQTFRQFLDEVISIEEYQIILKEDMLKYCDRDTLAMVVVLQKIIELVTQYDCNFKEKIDRLLREEENDV
ncbi:DUF2779 domain-containing protein [Spiroplasma taiwanense]|uniref:DUF2779 domain-containing protein n=1 Tax=Spiroplasma taiwanense CT-1 TaxID=1276220 RepID=S5MB53_9MOLU|nr:DUF2779 domain-containing protein [Spiroplasma taiwanense]AGR41003.1 hypothetical protein STAIW_v1c03450 [Spiroplasma taiwanense CT-1]